ncbi:MAG: hypothetical protein J6T67_09395 [Paludibacteraceae bacterium]|nr:hypothetical protein [Paludibacteraceae bacterium]
MAIDFHHLHPGHDDELSRLKARIAELEKENAELKEAQRWRKFSYEKPPKYTWCLVSGKSQMGNYIVIRDFFEEYDWAENPSLDDDALDIEYWKPLPSAPKEEK